MKKKVPMETIRSSRGFVCRCATLFHLSLSISDSLAFSCVVFFCFSVGLFLSDDLRLVKMCVCVCVCFAPVYIIRITSMSLCVFVCVCLFFMRVCVCAYISESVSCLCMLLLCVFCVLMMRMNVLVCVRACVGRDGNFT